MKSVIIKILFVVVLTYIATAYLYPMYEGWKYELEIFQFVFFASVIIFVLTETVRYFYGIIHNKKFTIFSLVFYVVVWLISIFGLSNSIINYLDYKNDFTRLYPPELLNEKLEAQDPIVVSDKTNPEIDSIDRDNVIKWIDAHGGLPVRKKAFEESSLNENERKIYKSFTMFLAFSFSIFFSLMEIRFYGMKWSKVKSMVDDSKLKIKEHSEPITHSEKMLSEEYGKKIKKARHLVSQDRANEALEILFEICPKNPHFQNQLIGLKTRLARTKKQIIQNTLDNEKILISSNQISQGILALIDNIELELKNENSEKRID